MWCLFPLAHAADPVAPAGTLDLDALTAEVLAVNPEARAAEATVARDAARARAAGAWPDPMVAVMVSPLSIPSMPMLDVDLRQALPLWGALRADRGMAAADADGAAAMGARMDLELAAMAAMAWADWYTVHRELALIEATLGALREARDATLSRYSAGQALQREVLQADAEIGILAARLRATEAERDVLAAQINALVHRDPTAAVPAPPLTLTPPSPAAAERPRPELAEAAAMRRAAEAGIDMALADRWPMVELMASWNAAMMRREDRPMVGVGLSLPLDQGARAAQVDAARAEATRAAADEERAATEVALAAAVAARRYSGQQQIVATLEQDVLPASAARVEAARASVAAGLDDVRALLDAERAHLDAEVEHARAVAALVLRARELELATGAWSAREVR